MMRQTKDEELFAYFKRKLERVRFIQNSIELRRETIKRIAEEILRRQQEYFRGGKKKPMTMAEISETLGIHPSTVSRAIKGKYIQFPAGMILMRKLFFGGSFVSESGEDISIERVKEKIIELVGQEDKKKPYSDEKLAVLLREKKIHVSRRAVAKYRDELGIKGSFERKQSL